MLQSLADRRRRRYNEICPQMRAYFLFWKKTILPCFSVGYLRLRLAFFLAFFFTLRLAFFLAFFFTLRLVFFLAFFLAFLLVFFLAFFFTLRLVFFFTLRLIFFFTARIFFVIFFLRDAIRFLAVFRFEAFLRDFFLVAIIYLRVGYPALSIYNKVKKSSKLREPVNTFGKSFFGAKMASAAQFFMCLGIRSSNAAFRAQSKTTTRAVTRPHRVLFGQSLTKSPLDVR